MSASTPYDTGRPAEAPPPELTGSEVLRSRGVRPLLAMFFLSTMASMLQTTALLAHVYSISHSKLDLGFVGLAEFAPAALLVLVTGSIADRYNRRLIVLVAIAAEVVCALLFLLYARTNPTSVGPMFAIVVAFGVARAFQSPAARAMPPMVAPHGGMARVVAMNSISWQAATISGPAIAGFLFEVDPGVPYAAVMALYVVTGLAVLSLPHLPPRHDARNERATLATALGGLRVVRRSPILLGAIALDLFAVLFGGATALIPAIATERLGVGPSGQGWLRAAGGIGASITGLILMARPVYRSVGRVLLLAVGIFGVATIALGLTRSYAIALLAMAVLSGADMVSVFIRGTLVPLATPDEVRGRVNAVEMVFIGASNELGAFESGVAAAAIGTVGAIVSGGVATLVIVGVWWWRFPDLRDVDQFSDIEHRSPVPPSSGGN